jgi:hypothetical protein
MHLPGGFSLHGSRKFFRAGMLPGQQHVLGRHDKRGEHGCDGNVCHDHGVALGLCPIESYCQRSNAAAA